MSATPSNEKRPTYERAAKHDKRFARGDDYAGDAWLDRDTGALVWVAVGHDANAPTAQFADEKDSPYTITEQVGTEEAARRFHELRGYIGTAYAQRHQLDSKHHRDALLRILGLELKP